MDIQRFPEKRKDILKRVKILFVQYPILTSIVTILTVCIVSIALYFQIKDYKLRNRPILSIPVRPVLQVDSHNKPKALVFEIKNLSDIPATNVSVVSEIFINGNSVERMGPTSYERLDKENPLSYKIYTFEDTTGKYVRVKILVWYEGLEDAGDAWFESGLEEILFLDYQSVTEEYAYEKAHWGEKLLAGDSDIYTAFLNMKLRDSKLE
jgi:hypothetical protein